MFPIRDHNPSGRIPFVTWGLMAVNIAVFLGYAHLFFDTPRALNAIFLQYGAIPLRITSGEAWQTLITSMFFHGGWMHLIGNMLFLFIFGDNIEDEMGHLPYLGFYLVCGVAAGLIQVMYAPDSAVPIVGASGAIAGVMGAYLLLFPKARVDILLFLVIIIRVFPIPAWIILAVWFGLQFLGGIGSDAETGGVAYWAHAGGFIAGFALMIPLWLKRGGTRFWQRTQGRPPHPEATYSVSRIPKIRR